MNIAEGHVCSSIRLAKQACHFYQHVIFFPYQSLQHFDRFTLSYWFVLLLQAVCLEACKKLHQMGAFTDIVFPDKCSGEEGEKENQAEEG